MSTFIKDVIWNLTDIQNSIVTNARVNRGKKFEIKHWKEITDLKQKTPIKDGMSRSAIEMYRNAAIYQYESLSSMTETIYTYDEPWLENMQAPVIIELLKEIRPEFKKAVDMLCDAIQRDEDGILEKTVIARYTGQYGPTWIFGSRNIPGTQKYLYQNLLSKIPIDDNSKGAIAYSRMTTYANLVGYTFVEALNSGCHFEEAIAREKEMLVKQWRDPVGSQIELMDKFKFKSYSTKKYMQGMKVVISKYIKGCIDEGVSFRNIIFISTLVGDLHHVSQTVNNVCKDDMSMAIMETVARCLENTLKSNADKFSSLSDIPIFDITGTASAYIMNKDGFTSSDLEYLIGQRHKRLITKDPLIYQHEDMHEHFINFIRVGEEILSRNLKYPEINGVKIDLSPIDNNPVIQDPASYTWGQIPMTARFSAMMNYIDSPFMLITDPAYGPIWVCTSADPNYITNKNPYEKRNTEEILWAGNVVNPL